MPSCNGSNCGACNCNCSVKTEYIHMDKKEREKYEERIKKLENEISEKQETKRGTYKKIAERLKRKTTL